MIWKWYDFKTHKPEIGTLCLVRIAYTHYSVAIFGEGEAPDLNSFWIVDEDYVGGYVTEWCYIEEPGGGGK
jgi:hypothetical protein